MALQKLKFGHSEVCLIRNVQQWLLNRPLQRYGGLLQQDMGGIGHVSVEQSWVHVGAVVRPDMLCFFMFPISLGYAENARCENTSWRMPSRRMGNC